VNSVLRPFFVGSISDSGIGEIRASSQSSALDVGLDRGTISHDPFVSIGVPARRGSAKRHTRL
jgi:hypothetical protein